MYTDYYYQTATKNVLPFIHNSELCMCYFVLTRHFSTVLPLERFRPSTPRITHRAIANWLVSPPILSSALVLQGFRRVAPPIPSSALVSFRETLPSLPRNHHSKKTRGQQLSVLGQISATVAVQQGDESCTSLRV